MEGGPFVARRRPPPRRGEAHCATSLLANWGPGCEDGNGVVTQTIAKEKKKTKGALENIRVVMVLFLFEERPNLV
jgi:hypothetical protein